MGKLRVKAEYEICGDPWGGTEKRALYAFHNMSNDTVTFYEEDGSIADMLFEEWSSGKDKWDVMNKLWFPFKDKWGEELLEGVEYYTEAPWEANEA